MYAQRQGLDAAARLSRLAEMRQRLNRRFGPGSSRPSSALGHLPPHLQHQHQYPDPLLGPATAGPMSSSAAAAAGGRMNSFPSHVASAYDNPDAYGGEMDLHDLALARRLEEDEYSEQTEASLMHHSMPNIHMGSGGGRDVWNPYNVDVEPSLHHSAPDLLCSESFHRSAPSLRYGGEEGGDESMSTDMDPIPLDQYTPKPFPKKRLGGGDEFKKAISMTLSPTSPSTEAVSRDLLACLEKLTGSTIKDENPFEPLPLDVGTSTSSLMAGAARQHEPMDAQRVTRDKKPSPFSLLDGKLTPPRPPFSQG
jgi:hypothetical protein